MGQLSNRRAITGLTEVGAINGLSSDGNNLYVIPRNFAYRYSYDAQNGIIGSRVRVGRVSSFRGLGGNNVYVSDLSGQYKILIGSITTDIDDAVTGIHKVGNKIIISYGTSIANYRIHSTQPVVSNRRFMGTVSGIDNITSLTVFGDKLLVAGNVNNTAILFEMDYDLTTNTISNIEQVTGTFQLGS